MCKAAGLKRDRLASWRSDGVLPADWFSRKRLFTFPEILVASLIVRHDDENGNRQRLRGIAETLVGVVQIARMRAIDPAILPLACVHVALREADAFDGYAEAAAAASFDPGFQLFSSYAAYRRCREAEGIDLAPELKAAIEQIQAFELWDMQLFCDLVGAGGKEGALVIMTYDFDGEQLVTSYEIGSPLPTNLDDDDLTRATMIPIGPALRSVEAALAAVGRA